MPGSDNKQLYDTLVASTNQIALVAGSFELDGTNEVVNVRGDGFTVAYDDVGKFKVTFARPFTAAQLISFVPSWEDEASGTADDVSVDSEAFDATDSSIIIRASVASTLTDDDGPRINFIAMFQANVTLAVTRS